MAESISPVPHRSAEEESAAFADPDRGPRAYQHRTCGKITRMTEEVVRSFLADPHRFNDWVFCSGCDTFVRQKECAWTDSGEELSEYLGRLKSAVPPPAANRQLAWAIPPLLAILASVAGHFLADTAGAIAGGLTGLGLGIVVVMAGPGRPR